MQYVDHHSISARHEGHLCVYIHIAGDCKWYKILTRDINLVVQQLMGIMYQRCHITITCLCNVHIQWFIWFVIVVSVRKKTFFHVAITCYAF